MINKENRDEVFGIDTDIQRDYYKIVVDDAVKEMDMMTNNKDSNAVCKILRLANENKELQDIIMFLHKTIVDDVEGYQKYLDDEFDRSIFGYADKLTEIGNCVGTYIFAASADEMMIYIFDLMQKGQMVSQLTAEDAFRLSKCWQSEDWLNKL